jgi:hypothetical protein
MYLRMNSDLYGTEDFGPYSTTREANAAMARIHAKAKELADGVERWFRMITNREHDNDTD